jgi:hypothetical protein
MTTSDDNQKTVADFLSAIEPLMAAYQGGSFTYLALKRGDRFVLIRGIAHLRAPKETPFTHFSSDNVRAGRYRLTELEVGPRALATSLLSGTLTTPGGELDFPQPPNGDYNTWHAPSHPSGLQAHRRLGVLLLTATDNVPHDRMAMLDWELRAAITPYDGLAELMSEYGLGSLQNFASSVEVAAPPVAEIDPSSRIDGQTAFVRVRLARELATAPFSLGYRIVSERAPTGRHRIESSALHWAQTADGWEGAVTINVPERAAIQCFASYDGVTHHSSWISDRSTGQNPRRTVYEAIDPGLAALTEIAAREPRRGHKQDARDFEAAVSWVLWMNGFSAIHLGAVSRTQDGADLIAATPAGHIAVIECTTGVLKADKLALLHDRAQTVRRQLEIRGSRDLRVLAIAVTSQPIADVEADIEGATKRQIFVVTREQFHDLIDHTRAAPDADRFFQEAEQSLKFARMDPVQSNPLGLAEPL